VVSWIKNIPKQPLNSFWLQLSNAKFYPDFIVKLQDDRVLVIEYKGGHLMTNDDTKEKALIGKMWGDLNSNGEFLMVGKGEEAKIREIVKKI